jgi:hypothetical protein
MNFQRGMGLFFRNGGSNIKLFKDTVRQSESKNAIYEWLSQFRHLKIRGNSSLEPNLVQSFSTLELQLLKYPIVVGLCEE